MCMYVRFIFKWAVISVLDYYDVGLKKVGCGRTMFHFIKLSPGAADVIFKL